MMKLKFLSLLFLVLLPMVLIGQVRPDQFPVDNTPEATDAFYTQEAVAGTPTPRKITLASLRVYYIGSGSTRLITRAELDASDAADLDKDPLNEIELPTGGALNEVLKITSVSPRVLGWGSAGGSSDILEGSDNGLLYKNIGGTTLARFFYRLDEETLWFGKSNSLTWGNAKINSSVVLGTGITGSQLINPFASVLIGYNVAGVSVNGNSLTSVGYQSLNFLRDGFNVSAFGTDSGYNLRDVTNVNVYGRHQFFTGDGSVLLDGTNINSFGVDGFPLLTSATNMISLGNNQGLSTTSVLQSIVIGDEAARYKPSFTGTHIKGYQAAYIPSNPAGQVPLIAANIDGYRSMYNQHSFNYATARGYQAGFLNAYDPSYISTGTHLDGYQSGFNVYGLNNTFLGYRGGARTSPTNIDGSITIGYRAGDGWIGSNEFALDNSNTVTPLYYGNFTTNTARINGTLEVLTTATNNSNTNVVVKNTTTGAFEINTNLGAGGVWETDGTNVWRLSNVGIGVASPTFPLSIAGNIQGSLSGSTYWLNNDASGAYIRTFGVNKLSIRGSGGLTNVMFDNVNERVGVGTSSPLHKLHVVGDEFVTGARIDSDGDVGTTGQVLSTTVTGTDWVGDVSLFSTDGTITDLTRTVTTGSANTLLFNHSNSGTSSFQSAWNSIGHTRLLSITGTGQSANYYHTGASHIMDATLPGTSASSVGVSNGSVALFVDDLTNSNQSVFNVFNNSVQLENTDGTTTAGITLNPTKISLNAIDGEIKINGTETHKTELKASAYTTTFGDNLIVLGSAAITLTLDQSPVDGQLHKIGNMDSFVKTVTAGGSTLIGTTTTITVSEGDFVEVLYSSDYGGWLLND